MVRSVSPSDGRHFSGRGRVTGRLAVADDGGRSGQILRSAALSFAERDYEGTNLDDICSGVGIAKPTLYHHFRSKAEILYQVLDDYLELIPRHPTDSASRHQTNCWLGGSAACERRQHEVAARDELAEVRISRGQTARGRLPPTATRPLATRAPPGRARDGP
jgi:AcrR family transcriptional regulator